VHGECGIRGNRDGGGALARADIPSRFALSSCEGQTLGFAGNERITTDRGWIGPAQGGFGALASCLTMSLTRPKTVDRRRAAS
jgi:hypothetical protein